MHSGTGATKRPSWCEAGRVVGLRSCLPRGSWRPHARDTFARKWLLGPSPAAHEPQLSLGTRGAEPPLPDLMRWLVQAFSLKSSLSEAQTAVIFQACAGIYLCFSRSEWREVFGLSVHKMKSDRVSQGHKDLFSSRSVSWLWNTFPRQG